MPTIKTLHLEYDVYRTQINSVELLFNPSRVVGLQNKNIFQPMPLKNRTSSFKLFYQHNEVEPRVEKGSYIIKIAPQQNAKPVKVRISMNDLKMIPLNGDYLFKQPVASKSVNFAVYLPEKGEFRVMLESCQHLEIGNIMFETNHSINSHQILVQNYNYFYRNLEEQER